VAGQHSFRGGRRWPAELLRRLQHPRGHAALADFAHRAGANAKGAALGVYNTTQALGLFVGGALGGWLVQHYDAAAVFLCDVLMVVVWLVAALTMPPLPARRSAAAQPTSPHGILETKS
jgi:MFS family permease